MEPRDRDGERHGAAAEAVGSNVEAQRARGSPEQPMLAVSTRGHRAALSHGRQIEIAFAVRTGACRRDQRVGIDRRRPDRVRRAGIGFERSEEHTSELQSLMRISYAVFCLKKKIHKTKETIDL